MDPSPQGEKQKKFKENEVCAPFAPWYSEFNKIIPENGD